MKYTPAFNFQGTRFVIASRDYLADTKDEADKIGIATQFIEGLLFGFKQDKDSPIQEVPENSKEGKLLADTATLEGKDFGQLPIYYNFKETQ